jgi:hypothetical protein
VEDQDQGQALEWPRLAGVTIRDMTADQLGAVVAYLRASACPDEVLIRAVQTELTFRQAGIHPEPTPAVAAADSRVGMLGG